LPYVERSWQLSLLVFSWYWETWIAEVEIHIILSRYHQMQFNLGMVLAIGADAGTVFKDIKFLVRASKVPTTMPHIHQLNLVFDETKEPEMLFAQLSNARRVVAIPYEDGGKKH
jgi:hypothetical protein